MTSELEQVFSDIELSTSERHLVRIVALQLDDEYQERFAALITRLRVGLLPKRRRPTSRRLESVLSGAKLDDREQSLVDVLMEIDNVADVMSGIIRKARKAEHMMLCDPCNEGLPELEEA